MSVLKKLNKMLAGRGTKQKVWSPVGTTDSRGMNGWFGLRAHG